MTFNELNEPGKRKKDEKEKGSAYCHLGQLSDVQRWMMLLRLRLLGHGLIWTCQISVPADFLQNTNHSCYCFRNQERSSKTDTFRKLEKVNEGLKASVVDACVADEVVLTIHWRIRS
jgi:hypothetical protein